MSPAERREKKRQYAQAAVARAKKRRVDLIKLLGGKCYRCNATRKLHIDHVNGRDWEPREMSSHTRVEKYWREYLAGVPLRVACRRCNGWGGTQIAQMYENKRRAEEEG